jgi:hypothetical protein
MYKLFRRSSIVVGGVLVVGFSAFAIHWLWLSLTDSRIAQRGGFLYALIPLALAAISFIWARAIARWARRMDQQ